MAIVCTRGISAAVYKELGSTVHTVHSFLRLQTADLPWKLVVERAASQNLVRKPIMQAQCIIWDKASMSSGRILKLANFLHHVLAKEGESLKPFGGKQLITVDKVSTAALSPKPIRQRQIKLIASHF